MIEDKNDFNSKYQKLTGYSSQLKREALAIQEVVEKNGGYWIHFSQDVWLGNQELGKEGVCLAMATVFLKRSKTGEHDFINYVCSTQGRKEVMGLWSRQKSVPGWQDLYFNSCGLKRRFARLGDTIDQIAGVIQVPGYYSIGLSTFQGHFPNFKAAAKELAKQSGHAMAAVNERDIATVFDANFGYAIGAGKNPAEFVGQVLEAIWQVLYADFDGTTLFERFS